MNNEKYINYYIETLTATLTDAIVRNVSMQSNARITDEVIGDQNKIIEELKSSLESVKSSDGEHIKKLNETIIQLENELNLYKSYKNECDNVKHQLQHLDTFKNELIKERELTKKLQNEIDYLKLSPAKRKKLDNVVSEKQEVVETKAKIFKETVPSINIKVKDGGSF